MSQDSKNFEPKSQEGVSELQALLNAEWTELQQNEAITMRQKMGSLEAQVSTSLRLDDRMEETGLDSDSIPMLSSPAPSNIVTYVNQKHKVHFWTVKPVKLPKKEQPIAEEEEEEPQSTAPTIDDEIWQIDD
ncbi:uncharacterized protein LOC111693509 [Trichogramma pretiosum]|uniref:Uncharacterized protein n=1 Tax=Trichogramma kaykai TaxID=54128 RepID=A0ABD2WQY8_9HYME|nr:uncharacterized protein LOC111693509 [Trichogramma pretiosum]